MPLTWVVALAAAISAAFAFRALKGGLKSAVSGKATGWAVALVVIGAALLYQSIARRSPDLCAAPPWP
ncbi:hypothetical protein [Tabrizicola sp. BL-A-41-H6]|uniref:hypothetical protein n=1 Tax=Tabrizicola sp. BL-A-41-H6 TaxID=3421107 RepID=UPI003D666A74